MSTETPNSIAGEIDELISELEQTNPANAALLKSYVNSRDTTDVADSAMRLMQLTSSYSQHCALLLHKDADANLLIFTWLIKFATAGSAQILGVEHTQSIGHRLGEYLAGDDFYTVDELISPDYNEQFEVDTADGRHLLLDLHGTNTGDIVCDISDASEIYSLRSLLNTHLQRHELMTESLVISNSNMAYADVFTKILERVGFHIKPKRALVFIDDIDGLKGLLNYQWTAPGNTPMTPNLYIDYERYPSWRKMLTERNMILGFQLKYMPEDIQQLLARFGMNNIYAFPLTVSDELHGAFVIEAADDTTIDNLEINYIKIISILLSGHINRKMIYDDLICEKERAEEADKLKSSFLVNMSHDIRIPMNSIIGFSDLLADNDLTQTEREEFIDMINKSGQDLISLIDNIIDISKIETGQLSVKKEECSLSALMHNVMDSYRHNTKLEERDDLVLQLDFPEKFDSIQFSTDIFRFHQICINLIDNAIKFTDSGSIKFGISNAWGNIIEFYVQDTGIGISEDEQHLLFKRFSKIDRTYAREYNGTGLGLSICKSLIEMLGGTIRLISVPGKGSTFYFTHPLSESVPETLNNLHEVKSLFNWERRSIVIVNNIEQDCKYLKYILSNTGIRTIWFATAQEAVGYFRDGNRADVVLMQLLLTSVGNIEPVMQIHTFTPVPIVALSLGNNNKGERELAIKAGCTDYIGKPLNMSKLLTMIDKALNC